MEKLFTEYLCLSFLRAVNKSWELKNIHKQECTKWLMAKGEINQSTTSVGQNHTGKQLPCPSKHKKYIHTVQLEGWKAQTRSQTWRTVTGSYAFAYMATAPRVWKLEQNNKTLHPEHQPFSFEMKTIPSGCAVVESESSGRQSGCSEAGS